MSESEKMGRCRQRLEEAYSGNTYFVPPYAWITADAIDRIAADVAAIKKKVDAISPEDVAHLLESEKAWVRLVEEKETAAIRERDQWREEARIAVINRDEARAEVERLRAELEQRQPAGNSPEIPDSSPAAPQPAGQGISPKVADTQPTGNAAPAAGWLTEREQHALRHILAADVEPAIRSILSRAGSPPVVDVPELGFLGPMTGREQGIVLAYRDALDKAGVQWKEVPRE